MKKIYVFAVIAVIIAVASVIGYINFLKPILEKEKKSVSEGFSVDELLVIENAKEKAEFGDEIEKLISNVKQNENLRITLANAYFRRGFNSQAIAEYQKALASSPEPGARKSAYMGLSNVYDDKGMYEEALSVLNDAKRDFPDDGDILHNFGMLFLHCNDVDRAIEYLEKASSLKSNDRDVYHNLGIAYFKKGDYEKAVNVYENILVQFPGDARAHYNLAMIFINVNQKEYAVEDLKETIKCGGDKGEGSLAYLALKKISGEDAGRFAMQTYERALREDPDNFSAYFNLALIYNDMDRLVDAIENLRIASRLAPLNASIIKALGTIYVKDDNLIESAETQFIKALKVDARDIESYYYIGVINVKKGDPKRAIRFFQKAIEIKPRSDVGLKSFIGIANILADMKNFRSALSYMKRCVEIFPDNPDAYFNLGKIFFRTNDTGNALNAYKKALELNPKDGKIYMSLGNLYFQSKQYPEAKKMYKTAVELDPSQEAYFNLQKMERMPAVQVR